MGALLVPLDVAEIDGEAEPRHEQEFNRTDGARDDHRRQQVEVGAAPDLGETRARGAASLGKPGRALPRPRVRNVTAAPRPATTHCHSYFFIALLQSVTPCLAEAG